MSDGRGEVGTGASRRAVFLGAGAAGATALLAACGTEDPGGDPGAAPPGNTGGDPNPGSTGSEPNPGSTTPGDSGDNGAEGGLATVDEVEVGGGVIIAEETVVVTQPSQGTFKGFSAACTHQGCTVSSISDGIIHCACHGSQYSIEDGSVVRGPTTRPLPAVEISVDGDQIVRA